MSLTPELPLVGRERLHAQIIGALDGAARGDGRVLILSGEAGAGKSRLAQDAVAAALARGFRVLSATGSPIQRDLHYALLIDLLRPLVRRGPHGARAALLDGLPALQVLFEPGWSGATEHDRVESLGDPALERTRLYESVRRLLARAARAQPMLIVLDDTHWADPGSLAAMAYSAWGSERHSAVLVVCRRTGEPDAADEDLVRALRRLPSTVEIEVGPLDAPAVSAMAGQLLGGPAPRALVDLLVERTGGLALFVRAVVGHLVGTGRLKRVGGHWVMDQVAHPAVPAEVREILRARIEALPEPECRVVELIAVSGGSLQHDLLVAASDTEPLAALPRLLDLGLIVEDLGGLGVAYRVMHPLLAEVAGSLLPEVRRRRLHARLAAAIGHSDSTRLDMLAHHLTGAGDEADPESTFDVLVAALDSALDSRAGAAAVRHADAALVLARRLDRPEELPSLLERRARGCVLAGDSGALAASLDAAMAHLAVGRRQDWGRLLVEVSNLEWDRGQFDAALEHIDAAVNALSQWPEHLPYLRALTTRMAYLSRQSSPALAEAVDSLEAAAASTHDPAGQIGVAIGRMTLAVVEGDLVAARTRSSEVLTTMEASANPVDLERFLRAVSNIHLELGDHAECQRLTERGIAAARRAGVPSLETVPRALQLAADLVTGDWTRLEKRIREVLELGNRTGSARAIAYALVTQSQLATFRGDVPGALDSLEESRRTYGGGRQDDWHLFGFAEVATALADRAQGRFEEAATRIERRLPALRVGRNIAVLTAGEARCALGDLEAATAHAISLLPPHDRGPWAAAVSSQLLGLVAVARGDRAEGANHLKMAARKLDALGLRHPAASAWLDWAGASDDAPEAAHVLSEQIAFLDSIGARPLANRGRHLLRDLGLSMAPPRRGSDDGGPVPGQLSARELEVAELVAHGLSNADIASRLFISPRTVTTHLQHVYERLGVSSRTALTRWVLDQRAPTSALPQPDYVPRNT